LSTLGPKMKKQRSVATAAAAFVILFTFLLSVNASAKEDSMESARERVRARLETRQAFPDRPKIITKHHFMRERKSSLVAIPKPFVVSTELNVRLPADHSSGRRNARTWKQHDGSTVIEGIRVPDDESDRTTWRNGRVINNIFFPDDPRAESANADDSVPNRFGLGRADLDLFVGSKGKARGARRAFASRRGHDLMAMESSQQVHTLPAPEHLARDFGYPAAAVAAAGGQISDKPIYYVVEEEDGLQPYNSFQPAATKTSQHVVSALPSAPTSSLPPNHLVESNSPLSGAAIIPHAPSSKDFVIQEHTYAMCPGCPTFSIPIPIPKEALEFGAPATGHAPEEVRRNGQLGYQPEYAGLPSLPSRFDTREKGFLERLGDEVISGIELIRSKAMSLVGMAGGSSGGGSSSRSGFEANRIMEKQGYYDAGSDLEASGSAVSSKAASTSFNPMMMATVAAMAVGGMAFMSSAATVAHMKGGSALRVDDDATAAREGEGRKRRRASGGQRQARSMAASHETASETFGLLARTTDGIRSA